MLNPPNTGNPALDRFLREVTDTIQNRVRPEAGWSLSDFQASVSEVISDKRDLIDIVTNYENINDLSDRWRLEYESATADLKGVLEFVAEIEDHSDRFEEVMEWWDQNYTIIFTAQEALDTFREIADTSAEAQRLVNQLDEIQATFEGLKSDAEGARDIAKKHSEDAESAKSAAQNSETAAKQSEEESQRVAREALETEQRISDDVASFAVTAAEAGSDIETWHGEINGWQIAVAEQHGQVGTWHSETQTFHQNMETAIQNGAATVRDEVKDDADRAEAAQGASEEAAARSENARDASEDFALMANDHRAASENARSYAEDARNAAELAAGRSNDSANDAMTHSTAAESARGGAETARDQAESMATNAAALAAQQAAGEAIAALIGDAPEALDTIYELAAYVKENRDGLGALESALNNRVVGAYRVVVQDEVPGPDTPLNQITFVRGGV